MMGKHTQRPNYRKSHAFDYSNTVPIFKQEKPGISGEPLLGQEKNLVLTSAHLINKSVPVDPNAECVPAWIAFDRQVLRYYAYFQESVHERQEEQFRIRRVNILYYLEDDTIHIIEPRGVNSGIPQGTLVRRHRIKNAHGTERPNQYLLYTDLIVGRDITMYGRTYTIVGCDGFTSEFMARMGMEVSPVPCPIDPYEAHRQQLLARMKPIRATQGTTTTTKLRQFLEFDRKVLRFYCVWDDTLTSFGDARIMVMHYYLADDTIEINEYISPNSGRYINDSTCFFKRNKIPKVHSSGLSGSDQSTFYTDSDLFIGSVLNVYGRPFLICDSDGFTQQYYRDRYGVTTHDPISYNAIYLEQAKMPRVSIKQAAEYGFEAPKPTQRQPVPLPEYNGWGSQEDSLGSCVGLIPKPPRKDLSKQLKFGSIVLRFAAVLNSVKQVDRERRFVVTYYMEDDTYSVYEPRVRNSGVVAGKWLERCKSKETTTIRTNDLFIGAVLHVCGVQFILIGADEFALQFMDCNMDLFPMHTLRATKPSGST